MTAISSLSGIQTGGISSSLINIVANKKQDDVNKNINGSSTETKSDTQLTLKLPTKTLNTSESKSFSTDDSRYINATLNSFKTNAQVNNQQTNRVSSLLDSLGGIQISSPYEPGGGKGGIHTKAWFEMQLRRIQNTEAQEYSEDNLQEIREEIKSNAERVTNIDDIAMPVSAEETISTTTTPSSLPESGVETAASNDANNQLAATTNETTAVPTQSMTAEMHSSQPTASQDNSPRVDIVV